MTKDEAIQQALVALGEFGYHGSSPRWERAVNDLRTALEQPPLPVQEPTPWRDMVVVSLVREGINKHRARELADHFVNFTLTPPLPEQRKPLTTEKVLDLFDAHGVYGSKWLEFARAIEQAHNIKEQP